MIALDTTTKSASPPLDIKDISSENLLEEGKSFADIFLPMEQELVILLTGPRGSLKSLTSAYIAISEMRDGNAVYSNLPIDNQRNFTDLKRLRTKELDIVKLYSLGREIEPGAIYLLDEFDKICAARWASTSNINRVLDWLATQIRKFGTSFILNAQNFWHIDSMWRDQIDIVIFCKDMKHSPWGKKRGLVRGELGFIQCYDKSGFQTGYENDPFTNKYAKPYAGFYIQAKPLWGTFDTKKLLGINEMLRRLRFIKEDMRMGPDGIVDESDEPDYKTLPNKHEREKLAKTNYVRALLAQLARDGKQDITILELSRLLLKANMEIKQRELGVIMQQSLDMRDWERCMIEEDGKKFRTTKYNLTDLEFEKESVKA